MRSPREALQQRAAERGLSLAALSARIGRNTIYFQQYVYRGTARRLPEDERRLCAITLDVDERELGARDPWAPPTL